MLSCKNVFLNLAQANGIAAALRNAKITSTTVLPNVAELEILMGFETIVLTASAATGRKVDRERFMKRIRNEVPEPEKISAIDDSNDEETELLKLTGLVTATRNKLTLSNVATALCKGLNAMSLRWDQPDEVLASVMASQQELFRLVFEGAMANLDPAVDLRYNGRSFNLRLHKSVARQIFLGKKEKALKIKFRGAAKVELTEDEAKKIDREACQTFKYDPKIFIGDSCVNFVTLNCQINSVAENDTNDFGTVTNAKGARIWVAKSEIPSRCCPCGSI